MDQPDKQEQKDHPDQQSGAGREQATHVIEPPKPEPHEPTQPSPVLPAPGEEQDATQPSAATAPDDAPGPQGAFDTHDWWAEQHEAAREEQARRQAAGEQDDESVAAAEEQGW